MFCSLDTALRIEVGEWAGEVEKALSGVSDAGLLARLRALVAGQPPSAVLLQDLELFVR